MFSFTQIKGSLRHSLIKQIFVFSLLIIAVVIVLDFLLAINQQKQELRRQFEYIENSTLDNITNAAWLVNKNLIQNQIDGIITLSYINYIEVKLDDDVFAISGEMPEQYEAVKYDLIYRTTNEAINLGKIKIVADTSSIYKTALLDSIKFLLLDSILLLLILYYLSSTVNQKILRHLEQMSYFMKETTWENIEQKFELHRPGSKFDEQDELDVLVSSFNFQRAEINKKSKALKLSEEMFYKVFQSSPDAIIISELESGSFIDVNRGFCKLYGYDQREEVIGKTAKELGVWGSLDDRETWLRRLQKEKSIYLSDTKFRKKSGELRDCVASIEIIQFTNKPCVVTTIRDTTESKRYQEQLIHSERRLHNLAKSQEQIREQERIGISREIHDVLGQALTSLKIDLTRIDENISNKQDVKENINSMIESIDSMVDVVRRISSQLRPAVLDDLGLEAAIEWVTKDFSQRVRLNYQLNIDCDELDLNQNRDTAIFRIYQEALINIARHSEAKNFMTDMKTIAGKLELIVSDDGVGITDEQINSDSSIGMISMQERASNIGAQISIRNESSGGTCVHLICPLHSQSVLN